MGENANAPRGGDDNLNIEQKGGANGGKSAKVKGKRRLALAAADIAECALFVALMAAAAYIRIPFPFVPLTFQTAVSILCGMLLGAKKGAISMCIYALAGLIGLPVFSSGGGFSYVLMPSFGYIPGFICAAAVAGAIVCGAAGGHSAGGNEDKGITFRRCILAALAALVCNYALGTAYFIAVWELSGYEGLFAAVIEYNVIYIPKDILLAVAAAAVARQVLPAISRRRSRIKRGR